MRLKKLPTEPTRRYNVQMYYELNEGDTIADLYDQFPNGTIDIYYYDGCVYSRIEYHADETDEEYNQRYEHFLKEKASYDKWYRSNTEAIEAELEKRRQTKEDKLKTDLAKLEKQRETLSSNIDKKMKQLERQ